MSDIAHPVPATVAGPRGARLLPYLLSLPALLVCIGILVPFATAAYYSLQRYKLSMPNRRAFIWFDQYLNFASDADFWHTVWVSAVYTVSTVGIELLFGLGIAASPRASFSFWRSTRTTALSRCFCCRARSLFRLSAPCLPIHYLLSR